MTTKRVVVRLTPDQKRKLREMAEWRNTSMTETVKRLIDEEYYARWPEEDPRVKDDSRKPPIAAEN
jgi:DNA-binding MarR family transcriptional regulator